MTSDRDKTLSEFIDAWNAGERPDVDDYIDRVPAEEQAELADELVAFLSFAPTPSYSEEALAAIRAEPIVQEVLAAPSERGGLLPKLLTTLRERFSISSGELAGDLVRALGLPTDREGKTAGYLARLERGELESTRVSRKVFVALARVFRLPSEHLEGAGDIGAWGSRPAPVWRADEDAAAAVGDHLEVLADALEAPGGEQRDEVDDLFLGGR